ncbi:trk system potassium uptake protein TrkH [Thermobifida halotolerans]
MTVATFAILITLGTAMLMLPAASQTGTATDFTTALFTAVSAVCVTGLIIVDTPAYWSFLGEWVILVLIQIGGLGIMTLTTTLILLVRQRINLRVQLSAEAETKAWTLGDVRRAVLGIIGFSLLFEAVTAVALTLRFLAGYGYPPEQALYHGLFHAVSAFNNAGFALYSDSVMGFATDPWIILPLAFAVVSGGLGFPVWIELWRRTRTRRTGAGKRLSLHTRITLWTSGVLLAVGTVTTTALEWNKAGTLGPMSIGEKILSGFFHSVVTRTAGFNSLDTAEFQTQTLFVTDMLMFIGGGSGGTAGGIKVTTFSLLAFVVYASVRGESAVHVGHRRLARGVERQAIVVALLAIGTVFVSTLVMMTITPFTLDQLLFEVISAFATVGLSTGITADLPAAGQYLLCLLMFAGRVGPITLASALALRHTTRRFEYPEERAIVG